MKNVAIVNPNPFIKTTTVQTWKKALGLSMETVKKDAAGAVVSSGLAQEIAKQSVRV